jgi:hypothetical protein
VTAGLLCGLNIEADGLGGIVRGVLGASFILTPRSNCRSVSHTSPASASR